MKRLILLSLLASFSLNAESIPETQCEDPKADPAQKVPYKFYVPINNKAAKCGSVDLRDKLPPVRNQSETGWCYAFAAADLISAHIGKDVSPIDTALRYQKTQETIAEHKKSVKVRGAKCEIPLADAYTGGEIHEAINMAIKSKGVCLEETVPASESFTENIKALEEANRRQLQLPWDQDTDIESRCHVINSLSSLFPQNSPSQMKKMLAISKKLNWQVYDEMVQKACQGKRHKLSRKIKVGNIDVDSPETEKLKPQAQKIMDEYLSKGKPVGYSSYFFFDGKSMEKGEFLNTGDSHATTVIGRKWNEEKGACEYLVRNSYGQDCSTYDWTDPVDPTRVLNKSPYKCEDGNLWIPENQLMSAMTGITWIK